MSRKSKIQSDRNNVKINITVSYNRPRGKNRERESGVGGRERESGEGSLTNHPVSVVGVNQSGNVFSTTLANKSI